MRGHCKCRRPLELNAREQEARALLRCGSGADGHDLISTVPACYLEGCTLRSESDSMIVATYYASYDEEEHLPRLESDTGYGRIRSSEEVPNSHSTRQARAPRSWTEFKPKMHICYGQDTRSMNHRFSSKIGDPMSLMCCFVRCSLLRQTV